MEFNGTTTPGNGKVKPRQSCHSGFLRLLVEFTERQGYTCLSLVVKVEAGALRPVYGTPSHRSN